MVFAPLEFTPLVYICVWCAIAMFLLRKLLPRANRWLGALIFAFLIAIVGDYFLGIRTNNLGFALGIFGYLLAHVGFIIYAWHNITGRHRFTLWVFGGIAVPFLILYFVLFWPGLRSSIPFAIAVLVYLLTSCITLASSIDISRPRFSWRWLYAAGVLCLLLSDATIGLHNFANQHQLYQLYMWPLFYSAMILIALSVVIQHFEPLLANLISQAPCRETQPFAFDQSTPVEQVLPLEEDGGEFPNL